MSHLTIEQALKANPQTVTIELTDSELFRAARCSNANEA